MRYLASKTAIFLVWTPFFMTPLSIPAFDGAGIPVESLVLETGRRDAALPDCSADPQSPFEGGADLRQGM